MTKLVVADTKLLRERFKASRETVNEVKSRVRAHAKMIDFADKAERLSKTLEGQFNGIVSAFERLNKVVVRRMEKTGLTAIQVITPEVRKDIIEPYKRFLEKEFKSQGVEAAVEYQNEKRAADIKRYGKSDNLIESINKYHDLVIHRYLMPLKHIEAQFNNFTYLKGRTNFDSLTSRVTTLIGTAEDAKVEETAETTQEIG